jgi:hypothetical protein
MQSFNGWELQINLDQQLLHGIVIWDCKPISQVHIAHLVIEQWCNIQKCLCKINIMDFL